VTTTIAGAPPATSGSRYWPGVVAAALTATVMPGFTVGALAPAIEQELQVSGTTVGLMISAFYAATAVGSPVAKRVAVRLPTRWCSPPQRWSPAP
jgi:MFS transporter, DHA1 family, inner membrane transport protein